MLAIIHKGAVPPITEVHAGRVCTQGFPPLMPDNLKQQVRSFDFHSVNKTLEGLFTKNPGAIRVERIVTSMGCLVTTCVAEVKHLPELTNGVIGWAKPIIEVNSTKAKMCMEWRKVLEKQACCPSSADLQGQARMQVGALFVAAADASPTQSEEDNVPTTGTAHDTEAEGDADALDAACTALQNILGLQEK